MLLDRFQLAEAASSGDPEANIAPIKINNDPEITYRSPYESIYARYDRRPDLQVGEGAHGTPRESMCRDSPSWFDVGRCPSSIWWCPFYQ